VSAALYTFAAYTLCVDSTERVLMVRESRPDCRGRFYVPAGRANPGEDPLATALRTTAEKTGLRVEPVSIAGIEHNPPIGQYPGQLRVFVVAKFVGGVLKMREDEFSLDATWVPYSDVRQLKLRSQDFLSWLDDVVLGQPALPAVSWRSLGAPT